MTSNAAGFDFARLIPGFDFLQQMAQPGAAAGPALSQWIAPTLDPQETGKRIQELKTVLFWLEQNATALKATIQALEVQQLTCQTLQDMQANMASWTQQMQQSVAGAGTAAENEQPVKEQAAATGNKHAAEDEAAADRVAAEATAQQAMEQAGQWWGSLLQTFGQIANHAQQEVAQRQQAFMQEQATASKDETESDAAAGKTAAASKRSGGAARTSKPRSAQAPVAEKSKKASATRSTAKPAARSSAKKTAANSRVGGKMAGRASGKK